MDIAVINTLNKNEWVVELSYRHSYGHVMAYSTCDDVAFVLKSEIGAYCEAAEKYGANLMRTALYPLIPKKNRMVFSVEGDAMKFKEDWIEPQLMALQLANINEEER